jgi:signal transduction histidine kinase
MFEDITEEKEAQKMAEENAQQQGRIEMANNMLHDIGNAMTGISTYALKPQMEKVWQEIKSLYQLRDLFNSSEDKLIQVFGEEKQRALNNFMKALITSFEDRRARELEFSGKISSAVGHVCSVLDLQRHYLKENASPLATKINLATIISDTLVMLSGNLKKKDIEVGFEVEDKNLNISGDQTRLMRVFLNIIKNVCEAFDEKESAGTGRMLKIDLMADKDKREIKVVFSDNGIGFAAGTGEKFFERGFTSKTNGFGIGLHECRSIIESHGGTMTMESEGMNTGAATVITFPYVDSLHN